MWVLDEVAADSEARAVHFFFLWAFFTDKTSICDGAAFGHLGFLDKETGVGAFDAVADALE